MSQVVLDRTRPVVLPFCEKQVEITKLRMERHDLMREVCAMKWQVRGGRLEHQLDKINFRLFQLTGNAIYRHPRYADMFGVEPEDAAPDGRG